MHAARWARPRDFLDIGQRLDGTDGKTSRHRAACLARSDCPELFVYESDERSAELQAFLVTYLPVLRMPAHESLALRRDELDVTAALDAVLTPFLAQLCWDVMMSDRLVYTELFPPRVDWETLFPTSPLDPNPRSAEELLQVVFESMPYLAPRHFRHLRSV